MGDSGLTQDDFRRLLQTPRPPPKDDDGNRLGSLTKTPKSQKLGKNVSVFAQPASVRRKKLHVPNHSTAEQDIDEGEDEDEDDVDQYKLPEKYRDRAAERRQQERAEELGEEANEKSGEDQPATKGLDFALLAKKRAELKAALKKNSIKDDLEGVIPKKESKREEDTEMSDAEDELDAALEKLNRGENVIPTDTETPTQVKDNEESTRSGRHILNRIIPVHNELFEPGRMAFVFKLSDEVGYSAEPFAIPDIVTRSKDSLSKRQIRTGWTEDILEEADLIIQNITQVMHRVKHPEKHVNPAKLVPKAPATVTKVAAAESEAGGPELDLPGDNIFAEAGSDYKLDEEALDYTVDSKRSVREQDYFKDLATEEDDTMLENEDVANGAVSDLLSRATEGEKEHIEEGASSPGHVKRQRLDRLDREIKAMEEDANDMDMYGLSSSVLPKDFDERRTMMYGDEEEDERTLLIDQGSRRNKKEQMSRWDFDDEEAWQKYKESVEIAPKGSDQYGVKRGDGRKRNREQRRGMSDKQKINRDFQQVKNMMEKKYGQSMD